MDTLRRLWLGDMRLADAFWNWAVIGGVVVNGLTSILFFALLLAEWTITAFIAGYALSVPYNIVATVAVWRSAGRYNGDRRWADAARIVTTAGMILLSVT